MKKKEKLVFALLLVIGFFLRVWSVGEYPPLLWDEAANGYNAYSILKTGRDEYGQFLPMIFKSFGDYKPGLYVYLTVPFVAIFGLSQFAVRIPSVILGSLAPLILYLLVREIFKNKKLAFYSALILVFLPWQIHFSRGGWESNVLIFFLVLGSWLFIKKKISWALLSFLLGLYVYQGAKMMVPLVLLGLIAFFSVPIKPVTTFLRRLMAHFLKIARPVNFRRKLKIPLLIISLLIGVWYLSSFSGKAGNRLKVMSLFSYSRPAEEIQSILTEDGLDSKNLHFSVFHGEWLHFTRGFLTRYFNHFSPQFLAFEGDWTNPRHSAPYFGAIGHLNFILFILGLCFFFFEKRKPKEYFLVYLLLIAPLPAAMSRDIISGVRSLTMVIPLAFFIGFSVEKIVNLNLNGFWRRTKPFLVLVLGLVFLLDFSYYLDLYYKHMVVRAPKDWLYGHKEVINFVRENSGENTKVLMTNFYGQPHIFYLFYSKYLPEEYQKKANLIENQFGDVGQVNQLDNIVFKYNDWNSSVGQTNSLVIFSDDEILRSEIDKDKEGFLQLESLGVINGKPMFYGYQKK